jgi:hypothetical protein
MLGLGEEVEGAFGSEGYCLMVSLKRVAAVEGNLSVSADYIGPIIRMPTASSGGTGNDPGMVQAVISCG